MIKVGNRVYIVPDDKRDTPYYRTVVSIGRKYITVDDNPSYNRFYVQTRRSVDDKNGWNPRLTLYESERDYQIMQEMQNERYELISKIQNKLPKASLEKLEQIYKLIL